MTAELDVAVIGAGPYGLSIAAHLSAAAIDNQVFGAPMNSWRNHMPPGMCLKSYGESSSLFDPHSAFTLEAFCRERGIEYDPIVLPVRLETFIAYCDAFRERFVPRVDPRHLVGHEWTKRGHELTFDDGHRVTARRVVIATGVVHYKHVPEVLLRCDSTHLSHSSDHGPIEHLAGRRVAIVGRGSSALDLAALLTARGSAVTLLTRSAELKFQTLPPRRDDHEPALRRAARALLRPPARGLGSGWVLAACAATPRLIHCLPDRARRAILESYLGPSGGYFIRDFVEHSIELRLSTTVERVEAQSDGVRLATVDAAGGRQFVDSDHIVAATGYRVDVRRLAFLGTRTLERIQNADGVPRLSANFESSLPGLYFVGLASARSFGPIMRFVEGAIHPAVHLARVLRRSRLRPMLTRAPAASSF